MYILCVCLTSFCAVLSNLLICDTEINQSINQDCVFTWKVRRAFSLLKVLSIRSRSLSLLKLWVKVL